VITAHSSSAQASIAVTNVCLTVGVVIAGVGACLFRQGETTARSAEKIL